MARLGRSQPFKPIVGRPAAGSTDTAISPAQGTVVIAGIAPTLLIDSIVQPDVGAAVIGGFAPTIAVTANVVAEPGVGAIVVTGLAPTLLIDSIVQPDVGSIEITGLAPIALGPVICEPGCGSIVCVGLAPDCIDSGAAVQPTGGLGRKGRGRPQRKQKVWVEFKRGQIYEVEDEEEARKVVRTIQKQAERNLRQVARSDEPLVQMPELPAIRIEGELLPWVADVQRSIELANEHLALLYAKIALEIARRRDEEDAITALLLT